MDMCRDPGAFDFTDTISEPDRNRRQGAGVYATWLREAVWQRMTRQVQTARWFSN